MARTPPVLSDLHPWLAERVEALADAHRQARPETSLALIWAHRSPAEQKAAHRAGRSRLDGVRRFSLHNYLPALAADLWVYTSSEDGSVPLYQGRPPRGVGLDLQLLQKGSLRRWYLGMARLAVDQGLEAGALWRTLKDGPHIQVPKRDRLRLLQEALGARGYACGTPDGVMGPLTRSAIERAGEDFGGGHLARGRLFPVVPAFWAWLHSTGPTS